MKSTRRLDYPNYLSQDDECVTTMMMIPPGEIMGQVHMADRCDKAPAAATKGIDAWNYY
jgi:hypothetical protein